MRILILAHSHISFATGGAQLVADEMLRSETATELAQNAMLARVCRAAVYALSKKLKPETWNEGNVNRGLSPESFSAAAEDLSGYLPAVRSGLRKAASGVRAS